MFSSKYCCYKTAAMLPSSLFSCARGHIQSLSVGNSSTVLRTNLHSLRSASIGHRWLRTLGAWSQSSTTLTLEFQRVDGKTEHLGCQQWRYRVYYGSKGFCSEASGKLKEKVCEQDSRERSEGNPPAAAEGRFHFKELYENPWTIPNYLCMARIILSPGLGYLIMEQYFHLSLGLFVLAGATDLLDGYIARNWPNQKSALGSALDPLADKILISILYISLTYAQLIPAPLTALIISRDVALIAAVFYVRYKTVPPPVTLNRFFNPCYTTARLKPTLISKVNTGVQLFLVAASLAAPVFHYTDSVLLHSLWYFTAVTTAASAYSYYHYGKKTVEVLNNSK
ncbi:hypothetical protein DNTS_028188 [Danionella cerebrum]|uniref:Cardiolipin synthase (CMP-forming) n=1 Tax=Danionella cerebrum TaxID=2873325 RepID=A0A553QR99_9TELE|nr:hypothetical protein DNTS_028188 [Danionella translucida]